MSDCHIDIEIEPIASKYVINVDAVYGVMRYLLIFLSLQEMEISISFVSAAKIQQINAQFRNRNQSTDVLSFPQREWLQPLCVNEGSHAILNMPKSSFYPQPLGDIVISLEHAEKNAEDIGHGLDRETCFLLVHGLLHLCGHDHKNPDEEALMCIQQQKMLAHLQQQAPVPWLNMITRLKDSA